MLDAEMTLEREGWGMRIHVAIKRSNFAIPVKLYTVCEDEVSLGVRARGPIPPWGEAPPISTTG
jgi:hypothetical protein